MNGDKFEDFGAFFRAHIMPDIVRNIGSALDYLRKKDPQEWLRIAMELRKRGSYDRVEQMREQEDAIKGLIEMISAGLMDLVPEFIRQHTLELERHYCQHGLELDDLLRKTPSPKPMNASESVDAQLRAWGYNPKPNDKTT